MKYTHLCIQHDDYQGWGEMKFGQLMSDSIINLRGSSKYHKDKSIFYVSKIPYQIQYTEGNTMQETQII